MEKSAYAYRKHGEAPYNIAMLHGGPGGAGDMYPLANKLSSEFGIIEPLQKGFSIAGQIAELHSCLKEQSDTPLVLVGFSWGAWLAVLFTAKYPSLIKKVILIGAGSFEEHYTKDITHIRMQRLTKNEREEVQIILKQLNISNSIDRKLFQRFGELMSKADAYDYWHYNNPKLEFRPDIFQSVWSEAVEMRKNGNLLKEAAKINCPLIAIHGMDDPHPWQGVEEPLSVVLSDFTMIKIEKCGHAPWKEKKISESFYQKFIANLKED